MQKSYNFILVLSIILVAGCASNSTLPVVRSNFDGFDLSSYSNCKGVFLVDNVYDTGFSVFASGDVARGEISTGDVGQLNGKQLRINNIEANEKNWKSASVPSRVSLSFGNQINMLDIKINDLICFN